MSAEYESKNDVHVDVCVSPSWRSVSDRIRAGCTLLPRQSARYELTVKGTEGESGPDRGRTRTLYLNPNTA